MIDWDRVANLRAEVGEDDFDEVVELFLEEVDAKIDELRNSPSQADMAADMHFLKGSALSLGFSAFSDLCQTGENYAAQGQTDLVDIPKFVDCYSQSRTEFLVQYRKRIANLSETAP